jgi:disulfide bond formation protein DsbB
MRVFARSSIACLLVLCVLVVGGLASAQALTHESHHAHHQKATHGTILCSWMCAAGQVLDTTSTPYLVEQSPVACAEQSAFQPVLCVTLDSATSRGPPFSSI